jgi:hypothetical protein
MIFPLGDAVVSVLTIYDEIRAGIYFYALAAVPLMKAAKSELITSLSEWPDINSREFLRRRCL